MINAKCEAAIPVRGVDRSRRIECPAAGLPNGRFPTLAAALERFLLCRERTLRFVEENRDNLRCRLAAHPVMGQVNCYEMLLSIAVHALRHAQQIDEIRAELAESSER